MESRLWMVIGLGNPGKQYQGNRHNIGFMVVDALNQAEGGPSWTRSTRFAAQLAKGEVSGRKVVLLKPQTYMNLSGRAVQAAACFYGIPAESMIVVHDDVDLPYGRLRLKAGGGDGGHKGVRSLVQELGSPEFIRLRCGIGRPARGDVTDYVLGDFTEDELAELPDQVQHGVQAVQCLLTHGLTEAMNRTNGPQPDQ